MLATQNVECAARSHEAAFRYNVRVTGIRRERDRVLGVTLDTGEEIDAPIVVDVSGPHSFKITEMAGLDGRAIETRALRHEVHVVPPPPGHRPEEEGYHMNDADIGGYYRPEAGDRIPTGSLDPKCDPKEWVDPDDFDREVSDDWMPIYDKSDLAGFYQAIGTSGNQFKTAPMAG